MNTLPHTRPAAPDPAANGAAPRLNDRLNHLFRVSLSEGRIHPLYLPILRYRHSRAAP